MDMAPRLLPIQIMIGSIPITLGTTKSVMVTSTEERETSPSKTLNIKVTKKFIKISKKESLKRKVTPQPKVMWPLMLELISPKSDLVVKGKEVAMDIDASFETLPPTKQGPRKNERREESQTSKLFDHYPLTALCAERLKRAKSNLEIREEVNKPPRPYSGPIIRSRACLMSQSIIDDSSISTTSSDTMETQSDFHSPLYEDSESIFQEENFPKILMDQFCKVLKILD
nr:hypothetical protein CFP56_31370 [Quercus suber]